MRILAALALLALPLLAGDEEDIRALFAAIAEAEGQRDPNALADRFDIDGLLAELGVDSAFARTLKERPEILFGRLSERLPPVADCRVRKVRITGEGTATAILDTGDVLDRIRWFLRRDGEGVWRVADFEMLGMGLRLSTMIGVGIRGALDKPAVMRLAAEMQGVELLLEEERYEEVVERFGDLEATGVVQLDAARWLVLATAYQGLWQPERTLACCARAEALQPDMPFLHYLRAYAHDDLEEPDAVVAHAAKFVDAVGESAEMHLLVGDAHFDMGRPAEALQAYRAALKEDPASVEAVSALLVALPADGKEEALAAFRALPDPAESFDGIAWDCDVREDWAALELIVKEQRKLRKDDPDADFWEARVLFERGAFPEAASLWRRSWPKVADPQERQAFVEWYLDAMVKAGRGVEGYRNAPDPAHAWPYTADLLADAKDAAGLEALLKTPPAEPEPGFALDLWRAEVAWLRGDYAGVVKLLDGRIGELEEVPQTGVWRAEDRLVRSLFRLGKLDAAAERADDLDLLLLVHAARGDVAKTLAAFETCLEEGWDAAELYGHDDLGPLLKDARFKELHVRHPPPEK